MKRLILLPVWIAVLISMFPQSGYARDDWHSWNMVTLDKDFKRPLSFHLFSEQRLRDNFSSAYLYNVATGLRWKASRYFDAGPFFLYESAKNTAGSRYYENRYYLEANLKLPGKRLTWSDRNRIEYRNRNTTDLWRYRNRLKVSLNTGKVSPYVSNEIFWDMTGHELNQNRFSAGISLPLEKHLQLTLYYLLQSTRAGSDWNENHALGVILGIKL